MAQDAAPIITAQEGANRHSIGLILIWYGNRKVPDKAKDMVVPNL